MKLTQCGQWTWRENEVSMKAFQKMTASDKKQHIKFLSTLKKEDLSSNDLIILQFNAPDALVEKPKPFLTMETL